MSEAASDLEEEAELEVDGAAAARADEQALRLPSERSRREGALRSLASSVGRICGVVKSRREPSWLVTSCDCGGVWASAAAASAREMGMSESFMGV